MAEHIAAARVLSCLAVARGSHSRGSTGGEFCPKHHDAYEFQCFDIRQMRIEMGNENLFRSLQTSTTANQKWKP
jgi:hypothetical protein